MPTNSKQIIVAFLFSGGEPHNSPIPEKEECIWNETVELLDDSFNSRHRLYKIIKKQIYHGEDYGNRISGSVSVTTLVEGLKDIRTALSELKNVCLEIIEVGDWWEGHMVPFALDTVSVHEAHEDTMCIQKGVDFLFDIELDKYGIAEKQKVLFKEAHTLVHNNELRVEYFSFRECIKLQNGGFLACHCCEIKRDSPFCHGSYIIETGTNRFGFEVPIGDFVERLYKRGS